MHWQKLAKIALLGTEHSRLGDATLEALSELGVDTDREAPLVLADGVAMLSQMRKAGFHLADYEGDIPSATNFTGSNAHSPKAVHLLHLMLSGPHADVLPEYLELLKKAKKTLPTAEIPAMMLRKGLPLIWQNFQPMLGEEGRWLLRQHPEWSKLLEDPTTYNWQTGSRQQRLKMLEYWRNTSPKFALELVQSTWETENATDKAAFLAMLRIGLSHDDEVFLEPALDDKRKEVRQVAAVLLAKIDGSALSQRMVQRAQRFFSLKNEKLAVQVGEEPDEAALRDGISKLQLDWAGGAKAAQLGQVVSLVNPVRWEAFFQKTPAEVLQLFASTDWQQTLRQAIINATVFHDSATWASTIAEQLITDSSSQFATFNNLDDLLELVPREAAHRFAQQKIPLESELPNQQSVLLSLMKKSEAIWPNELSLLVINQFRKDIFKDYRQIWQLQHLQDWLKLLGLRCDPALFDQLQTGWSSDAVQWRYWEKPVEDMLARVLFRREVWAEIVDGVAAKTPA